MIYLLDANVLIALIDQDHVHHDYAQAWFAETVTGGWATCPITEMAFLRIAGRASYQLPGGPAEMADILKQVLSRPGHVFWADSLSLVASPLVDSGKLTNHSQVTDTYLLALAAQNNGQLATFDRRLITHAVVGGASALHLIRGNAH
ncbi:DNA-binding protein [soil metagenome]